MKPSEPRATRRIVEVPAGGNRIVVRHVVPDGVPGQRPTVVLVHGLGVSGLYFEPLIDKLSEHSPVVVFDLPGAGHSARSDGELTVAGLAQVLLDIVDALDLGQIVLMGHSMGAQVVVEAFAQRPGVARAGVLLAPVVCRSQRDLPRLLTNFARTAVHEPFAAVWRSCVGYAQMSPRWMWAQCQAMLSYPIEERIAHVTADLMMIRATYDQVTPRDFLDDLRRRAGGHRVHVREIHGAAHHMMATHADVITAELLRITGIYDPVAEAEAEANLREHE